MSKRKEVSMKPMTTNYLKISKNTYKCFYQSGDSYGEFYVFLEPETATKGKLTISAKDPEYAKDLMDGLYMALVEES